jgi:hypothetical protein
LVFRAIDPTPTTLDFPHTHETRLRAAAEKHRIELMESLSPEGKAIYETVLAANDRSHEKLRAELCEIIAEMLKTEVDQVVNNKVNALVCNMQAYTDGIEAYLCASIGLPSQDDDPAPIVKSPGGAAEAGPAGTVVLLLHGGWVLGLLNPTSHLRHEVSQQIHLPIPLLVC